MEWKAGEEEDTRTKYVKARNDVRRTDGALKRSYYCHRSGHYKAKGHGLRRLKVQGTSKIGSHCPAAMFVIVKPSGKCSHAVSEACSCFNCLQSPAFFTVYMLSRADVHCGH